MRAIVVTRLHQGHLIAGFALGLWAMWRPFTPGDLTWLLLFSLLLTFARIGLLRRLVREPIPPLDLGPLEIWAARSAWLMLLCLQGAGRYLPDGWRTDAPPRSLWPEASPLPLPEWLGSFWFQALEWLLVPAGWMGAFLLFSGAGLVFVLLVLFVAHALHGFKS